MSSELSIKEINIREKFYEMYLEQIGVNVTFFCANDEEIKAHSIILVTSSAFFRDLLIRENNYQNLCIHLFNEPCKNVKDLLDLIYLGRFVDNSNIDNVKRLADLYKVKYQVSDNLEAYNKTVKVENGNLHNSTAAENIESDSFGTLMKNRQHQTLLQENEYSTSESPMSMIFQITNVESLVQSPNSPMNSMDLIEEANMECGPSNRDSADSSVHSSMEAGPFNDRIPEESSDSSDDDRVRRSVLSRGQRRNNDSVFNQRSFAQLSSFCIVCKKYYHDIKKHIAVTHSLSHGGQYKCEKCQSIFYVKKFLKLHKCSRDNTKRKR